MGYFIAQLLRFAWAEARACAFAVALFLGLALFSIIDTPLPRYDALLLYALAITGLFYLLRWETAGEVAVIGGFHLVGLIFEIVKVHLGSWSYPGDAWTKIGGVPLYSGFLYAAVGSYVCRAWRTLDLRLTGYRTTATATVSAAIYLNFLTHHFLPDLRLPLALLLIAATRRTAVHFTVGQARYRMPLALSFVLIGFFLWIAENIATYLGAWRYPYQQDTWNLVHADKFGAWALLVSVAFVLVAAWQARHGRLTEPAPETTAEPTPEPRTDQHQPQNVQ
ncbi:DUF817 domain-containing protein [Actinocorallia herbida]|uniref:DUF817 domain-containing protein n=1 Tax=Actinocorallia herbida TaxID=58109 RepID=UPI001FE3D864|nr:DUF817 domain-containing protein [Actinocorallia herbida]